MQTQWLVTKLKIGILSYRSAPFGGGQGIYVRDISQALASLGHTVDVISGEPYPELYSGVRLIKLPGMNLFETFSFKDRLKKFVTNPINVINIQEFVSHSLEDFLKCAHLEIGWIAFLKQIINTMLLLTINLLAMEC